MTPSSRPTPEQLRVLRWCERGVADATVSIWSPQDKAALAALVADHCAFASGPHYVLTPTGVALLRRHQEAR